MAMYGIAILPLISRFHNDSLTQKWYADDGSVVGKLKDIRALFDKLTQLAPKYGYLVNPPKCQLIIKPGGERQASTEFAGTNVEITQGARVQGSVGSSETSKNLLKDAEIKYIISLDRLGQFALTSPQNAYACLTKGVQQRLSFLSRITPSMDGVLDKVEERLGRVIPNIVGKERIQEERELFSLPLRMGGLNIALPQDLYKNIEQSIELSSPLASFNNDSFEIQQCELEQTKISLTESRHAT